MKRRTKVHFKAIHISIPIRLLEDLDETLSFKQSRSAKISSFIQKELAGDMSLGVSEASTRELMAALSARDDVEPWFSRVLLEILTKQS